MKTSVHPQKESPSVLVAHRGGAKYFQFDSNHSHLTLVESLVFPKGKLRPTELDADRAGRSSKSTKPGSLAMGTEPNSADHEELRSAKELADFVSKHLARPENGHLTVTAGPHFLGLIRKALSREHHKDEITFLAKDLAKIPDHEIFDHIPKS